MKALLVFNHLDLLGRKLWQHNSKGLMLLIQRMQNTIDRSSRSKHVKPLAAIISKASEQRCKTTTQRFGKVLIQGQVDQALGNSALVSRHDGQSHYLHGFGWTWPIKAVAKFQQSDLSEDQKS